MEGKTNAENVVTLDVTEPLWSRFYTVAPLVVIGTHEGEGYDLAPKHMATPVGWDNYFAFVCTPKHSTYRNLKREGFFTVSFPKPSQVVLASITAEPRCGKEGEKPTLEQLPTFPAEMIDGIFLQDAYLFFECKTARIIDGFGKNSIIVGHILAAHVDQCYLRRSEIDEALTFKTNPLLAYLSPGRYAAVHDTMAFPFPAGFQR